MILVIHFFFGGGGGGGGITTVPSFVETRPRRCEKMNANVSSGRSDDHHVTSHGNKNRYFG